MSFRCVVGQTDGNDFYCMLNGEIDAIAAEIRVKEEKRESTPDVAEKAIIFKLIDVLNSRLDCLIATRDKPVSPPPSPPQVRAITVCCALCCRRPPLFVCSD